MKRSANIQLGFLHGLILSAVGCSPSAPAPDPCEPELYDDTRCETAVASSGYYYRGTWVPLLYPHPSLYYAQAHDRYVARGGTTYPVPGRAYAPDYASPETRAQRTAGRMTANGTQLSAARMTALGTRGISLTAGRRGATTSRGGFGSIGTGRAFRGG
jgi:hypothetical protein